MSAKEHVPIGTYRVLPVKIEDGSIRYLAERLGKFLFWRVWQRVDFKRYHYARDAEAAIEIHRTPLPAPRIVP